MRMTDAFRFTRGARGIQDYRDVVGIARIDLLLKEMRMIAIMRRTTAIRMSELPPRLTSISCMVLRRTSRF